MLNFIVWVILIFFAFRLIWRYVVPFLLRRTLKKFEQRINETANKQNYDQSKEGEVRIDHIPDQDPDPSEPPSHIEYTDFEDIKDTDKRP